MRYDQSQLIRLPRPAAEVIIGNPSIADVAIQGGNLLAVTGKSYGVTNIIALDAQRNVIQDQRVVVERDSQSSLVLYKGAQRETYSCNPSCSPTLSIGDEKKYFELIAKALRKQDEDRHRQRRAQHAVDLGIAGCPETRVLARQLLTRVKLSFTENSKL